MASSDRRPSPAWARALAVLAAAVALNWAAFVNGQPFFHPDTVGYVRGPDVAIAKLVGPRFATEWSRFEPSAASNPAGTSATVHMGSTSDGEVLAGRSIYYGVLAWLGAASGGFWLTVLVQGLAVAGLVDIVLRALGVKRLRAYGAVMALVTLATPASFFVGFLMPDIWAGVAIAAAAALFALPARLSRTDALVLAGLVVFASLAHNSVAPVLLALMLAAGGWRLIRAGAPSPRLGLAVCALAAIAAVAGNLAFAEMVRHTTGRAPVTPPFLTARLVADGPGARYAKQDCHGAFVVCRFADRFPMDADEFLWGRGQTGVFDTASLADRRALGDEQGRFVLAAARAYPLQEAAAAVRNAVVQTFDTDLLDFDYHPALRASLTSHTPPATAAAIARTLAFREAWPRRPLWALQSVVCLASIAAAAWLSLRTRGQAASEIAPAALLFGLILVGVLANGVVCGVLSSLYGRYEARVIWTLPLAAGALALVSAPLASGLRRTAPQPLRV